MTVAHDPSPAPAGEGGKSGGLRARVGVFGIGLATYWPQFPGLLERVQGYQRRVEERVAELGGEVVSAGLVDSAQGAVLTRADQQQYRAGNAETLTRQGLGWALPIGLLQYWVRGLPAPGSSPTAAERDASNRLLALSQNGWRVALTWNTPDSEHAGLVRRVDLKDGANEIRLVIDTWRDTRRP